MSDAPIEFQTSERGIIEAAGEDWRKDRAKTEAALAEWVKPMGFRLIGVRYARHGGRIWATLAVEWL